MDTIDDIESSSKIKPSFMDFVSEDVHYKIISQRNLKAIMDKNNSLVDLISNIEIDEHLIKKSMEIITNFNNVEDTIREKQIQLVTLNDKYTKKKQSVAYLESRLKKLKNNLEKLKEANKIDERNHQYSLELFQKALQNYKLYLGYDMKVEDKSGKTKYTIILNFNLDDGTLSPPIKFIFDKKDDVLIDFNASDLMTNKQKKLLFNNFQLTKNHLALFYALRSCAVKKE